MSHRQIHKHRSRHRTHADKPAHTRIPALVAKTEVKKGSPYANAAAKNDAPAVQPAGDENGEKS
jgi:hypothetical protein